MPRRRGRKPKKGKSVKVTLIKPPAQLTGKNVDGDNPYVIMRELIARYHDHLSGAKIAIAELLDVKANVDGVMVLGKCKKGSDLDRELHHFDFVILINAHAWKEFKSPQKRALIDHELCHAEVVKDRDGELVKDEQGRQCYRTRKHDIEEFRDIVTRHGFYKADLELFALRCVEAAKRTKTLFDGIKDKPETNGKATGNQRQSQWHAKRHSPIRATKR
jgi:hypothetical protein